MAAIAIPIVAVDGAPMFSALSITRTLFIAPAAVTLQAAMVLILILIVEFIVPYFVTAVAPFLAALTSALAADIWQPTAACISQLQLNVV